MKFVLQLMTACSVLAASSLAVAQQEVRLKSGGVLLGTATIDGEHAVVQVGDATMRVPLANVAEIAAVAKPDVPQPRRLLMTALEAKILSGADKEVVGILADASRLSPEDPQIAFWHATSLLDAGYGQAAHDVLQANLATVRQAYPGAADRLASRISQRIAIEKLPRELVQRMDLIAERGRERRSGSDDDQQPLYTIFRVVDQRGQPVIIERQSIQVSGNDEQLEAFPEGYYLFSYLHYRNNRRQPCRLTISDFGVQQKTTELRVSDSVYASPQEIQAHRFDDGDKRQVKVRVTDREGEPIPEARVTLSAVMGQGGRGEQEVSFQADNEGVVTIKAFPGSYQMQVNRNGFLTVHQTLDVAENQDASEVRDVKLHKVVVATVNIEWRWSPMQGGETSTGNLRVEFSSLAGAHQGRFPFPIRFEQAREKLFLQMMGQPFGGRPDQNSPATSLRKLVVSAEGDETAQEKAARAAFESLDLQELEKASEKLKRVDFSEGRTGGRAPVELGGVYVAKLMTFNQQRGQPGELTFKFLIEPGAAPAAGDDSPFSGF